MLKNIIAIVAVVVALPLAAQATEPTAAVPLLAGIAQRREARLTGLAAARHRRDLQLEAAALRRAGREELARYLVPDRPGAPMLALPAAAIRAGQAAAAGGAGSAESVSRQ